MERRAGHPRVVLIIILLSVIAVFGAGRIGDLMGSVGRGIHQFKAELRDDHPVEASSKAPE